MSAQIDADNLMGLPTSTDFTEISGITGPQIGSVVFNLDDDQIYRFTSTGWQVISGENLYNTDGSLTGNRTVDMLGSQLNFDTDADLRSTITLRRTNNANSLGIAFRNSGNAYPTAIVMGTTGSGNSNGLDFYAGGNEGDPNNLDKTLALQNNNQIEFTQYREITATYQFDNNSPARFLGIETDGDVVTIDPSVIGSDDQNASEVPLVTDVDVNGVTTDPSPALETNVEEVIQAIAPITSKAGRVFYPPSIVVDASALSTTDETIDLYQQYVNQYDITQTSTVINGVTINYQTAKSTAAPNDIPVYTRSELYYYVTFADSSVFNIINLDDNGVLTYRIVGIPTDDNTIINVVFVVR